MAQHSPPFNWIEFPEGRARFSGGIRGIMDEQRHETFAVEVNGLELFGEIERKFLENNNDFNIQVVSFGYPSANYVGMPMLETCQVFGLGQIEIIQKLIAQLVASVARSEEKPSLLMDYPNARFMGEVFFRDGWALATEEATS
jgi:hypothetical protein